MSNADLSGTPFEFSTSASPRSSTTAKLERLATGCRWAEGPAYFPAGRYLVWSDIPNNRMHALGRDATAHVAVFRQPSEQHQRPHRRPPGPAGHLRASRPAGHRAPSSTAPSPCWPTAGRASASTRPTTSWCKSDGIDLVHRPVLRHRLTTTRAEQGGARDGACHVYPHRPRHRRAARRRRRLRPAQRPRLLARREAALHRRHRRDPRAGRPAPHPRLRRHRRGQR